MVQLVSIDPLIFNDPDHDPLVWPQSKSSTIDPLINRIDQPTDQSISQAINESINQYLSIAYWFLIDQSLNQSINRLINQSKTRTRWTCRLTRRRTGTRILPHCFTTWCCRWCTLGAPGCCWYHADSTRRWATHKGSRWTGKKSKIRKFFPIDCMNDDRGTIREMLDIWFDSLLQILVAGLYKQKKNTNSQKNTKFWWDLRMNICGSGILVG